MMNTIWKWILASLLIGALAAMKVIRYVSLMIDKGWHIWLELVEDTTKTLQDWWPFK
jgi:hypothetical protein|tara:strand:+ start:28 stop:198 length:171 start_codon:yes stop_codon:yes gene_type:complete